jgi:hypothetical protein
MANSIEQLGDTTSHDTVPDFESAKGYYWMKQVYEIKKHGTPVKKWPRKPRKGLAEMSFFDQVDKRLSRSTFTVGTSFDKDGKIIKE